MVRKPPDIGWRLAERSRGALLLAALSPACSGAEGGVRCLVGVARLDDVAGVPGLATVRWETDSPGTSVVEWGEDALERSTRDDGVLRRTHEVLLVGATPGTSVRWRVRSEGEEGRCEGPVKRWEVPDATGGYTELGLEGSEPGFTPGFRLLPLYGAHPWVILVDDLGRVPWAWPLPDPLIPAQVILDPDGVTLRVLALPEDPELGTGGV